MLFFYFSFQNVLDDYKKVNITAFSRYAKLLEGKCVS